MSAPQTKQVEYVQAQPAMAPQAQDMPVDPRVAARGLQPGGLYEEQRYCGLVSILIGCFLFPCICCCPIDKKETYTEPGTGRKVTLSGAVNV